MNRRSIKRIYRWRHREFNQLSLNVAKVAVSFRRKQNLTVTASEFDLGDRKIGGDGKEPKMFLGTFGVPHSHGHLIGQRKQRLKTSDTVCPKRRCFALMRQQYTTSNSLSSHYFILPSFFW